MLYYANAVLHYAMLYSTMLCWTILILYCAVLPPVGLNRCCSQRATLQKGCEHCTGGILCDIRLEKVHNKEVRD